MKSLLVIILVASCIVATLCAVRRETFVCKKGKAYIQNQCNNCFCIEEDDLVCTAMKCPENGIENCATGLVWQKDCNKCWCTNAGEICTKNIC